MKKILLLTSFLLLSCGLKAQIAEVEADPTASSIIKRITACFGCNKPMLAREQVPYYETGDVFVMDFKDQSLHKYVVYTTYIQDGGEHFPVRKALKETMTTAELNATQELMGIYNVTLEALRNYGSRGITQYESETIRSSRITPLSNISLGTYQVVTYQGSSDINVHSFVSTSSQRNNLYNQILGNHWHVEAMAHANKAMDLLDLGYLSMDALELSFTIKFPNGSSVEVTPSLTSKSLVAVPGTGVDSNNNSVPTNAREAAGIYHVMPDEFQNWSSFLSQWGGSFGYRMCNIPMELQCNFQGNVLTCTVITPSCRL